MTVELTGPVAHLVKTMLSLERFRSERTSEFLSLTEREVAVLKLVADGCDNPAIAARLGISRLTVQNHRSSIRHKLNIGRDIDYLKYALAFDLTRL